MKTSAACAALAPAFLLMACNPSADPTENAAASNQALPPPEPVEPAARPAPDAADNATAPTLPVLTPEAEQGETGARSLLLDFARAIELKRFGQAYALLSPADQRKWSRSQFAAIFADLGKITVAVPTGRMEGAAGSSYYNAPVTITAADKDGRPVRIEGQAVLRRVNVDGASPAQRRWHFQSLTLDWTH